MGAKHQFNQRDGFTLVELSIVLVIIGLIVGGILVGQSLIEAAAVRATITQIEKFNQATNTFYGKYGALPGDLNAQVASRFGFTPRGSEPGQGDGNGIIEGNVNGSPTGNEGYILDTGETGLFWVDLTTANGLNLNLIEGKFNTASLTQPGPITGNAIGNYYPSAKLGQGNYIYVTSAGSTQSAGQNYFGMAVITQTDGTISSGAGLTVKQAYDIDNKIDDGLPQSGNVTAMYLNNGSGHSYQIWAGTASAATLPHAVAPSSKSCFDDSTTPSGYSVEISNGANVNCALTFKMQAGD
jgi:prepilin-type N-terminal cleavage/methylation domain-containing protein